MKKRILIILTALLFLTSCSSKKIKTCNISDLKTVTDNMNSYGIFNVPDNFQRLTMKEALRIFEEGGSAIILTSKASCAYCLEAVPVLGNVAKKEGIAIYYINTEESVSDETFDKFISYVSEFLEPDGGLYVPNVFAVVDGKAVSHHIGATDDFDSSMGPMSDSQVKELSKIYKDLIKKIK